MNKFFQSIFYIIVIVTSVACSDDDSFTTSTTNRLTFGVDTICLDTVFSTIPSPHKVQMVYNHSGDGIRITNVRLKNGNQTGFRVNVNGSYLGEKTGWQVNDLELRQNDSLRVFVELTSANNNDTLPKLISDDLLFTLESGVSQKINLKAWSWDAYLLKDVVLNNDTVISNLHGKPVVIYGNLRVPNGVTLTVAPSTTIYFHNEAGLQIDGTLKAKGEVNKEITLRCDRLDRMVSNLTYDNNPGQWGGIHFSSNSYDNEIRFTDLHGATNAIVCDSSDTPTLSKLLISNTTIHNIKGNGIKAVNGNITIDNTQVSNTQDTCVAVIGGTLNINNSTIAQYYPFDANRGPALVFGNSEGGNIIPLNLNVKNSIIKGYNDDVIYRTASSVDSVMAVDFSYCILRTPQTESSEHITFDNCIFEDVKDTLTNGRNSFKLFDTDYFFYDFTPKEGTAAIGAANPATVLPEDRKGNARSKEKPDMGCYETNKVVDKDEENNNNATE